ncbi:hypothetical protein MWG46_13485 [Escherichia coli]|nr:hypothetical protein [Escherichia coli]
MVTQATGAIWHLAATALEDKTCAKFSHVPLTAQPLHTGLLGGHIEAVSVSLEKLSTM